MVQHHGADRDRAQAVDVSSISGDCHALPRSFGPYLPATGDYGSIVGDTGRLTKFPLQRTLTPAIAPSPRSTSNVSRCAAQPSAATVKLATP
ncbi:hypothetical protein ACFSTD_11090 [Novosphingobium colocasiae]